MRRKILTICAACITAAAILTNYSYARASEPEEIQSRGNLVLEDGGGMVVNTSDIHYLQEELETLFGELKGFGPDYDELPVEYGRRNGITSKGVIKYANDAVVIDSSNLTYLADEIDRLEWICKYATVKALNQINTYYTSSEGAVGHDPGNNNIPPEMASALSFHDLCNGILQSQSVEYLEDVQAKDPEENLLYYADENARDNKDLLRTTTDANDFPLLIGAAKAGNLSAGTAAWINGSPVIGNGADNRAYYESGYGEGYKEGYDSGKKDAIPTDSITVSATLRPDYSHSTSWCQIPIVGAQSVTVKLDQYNNRVGSGSYASINGITLNMSRTEGEGVVTRTWTKEEIGDATYLELQSVNNLDDREAKTVFTVTINY